MVSGSVSLHRTLVRVYLLRPPAMRHSRFKCSSIRTMNVRRDRDGVACTSYISFRCHLCKLEQEKTSMMGSRATRTIRPQAMKYSPLVMQSAASSVFLRRYCSTKWDPNTSGYLVFDRRCCHSQCGRDMGSQHVGGPVDFCRVLYL